jgi:tetratricopeptide (TPR) repeat protein
MPASKRGDGRSPAGNISTGDVGMIKDSTFHSEVHQDSHDVIGAPAVGGSQTFIINPGKEETKATKTGERCPICYRLAKEDYFYCTACKKDFICHHHQDLRTYLCEECERQRLKEDEQARVKREPDLIRRRQVEEEALEKVLTVKARLKEGNRRSDIEVEYLQKEAEEANRATEEAKRISEKAAKARAEEKDRLDAERWEKERRDNVEKQNTENASRDIEIAKRTAEKKESDRDERSKQVPAAKTKTAIAILIGIIAILAVYFFITPSNRKQDDPKPTPATATVPAEPAPALPKLMVAEYEEKAFNACEEKKYSQAISFAQQALALNPRSVGAMKVMGYSKAALGDKEGARNWFKKVLEINPNDQNSKIWLHRLS